MKVIREGGHPELENGNYERRRKRTPGEVSGEWREEGGR